MNTSLINKKYKNYFCRKILFNFYYFVEKIKRLLKLIYKLICFFLHKTVKISDLIKSGEANSYKIFDGELYILSQKLDINQNEFKHLPIGSYAIPDYHVYTIKNGIINS